MTDRGRPDADHRDDDGGVGLAIAMLKVFRLQAGALADARQHLRADLVSVMERKDVVRPPGASKNAMRGTDLSFDPPSDAEQGRENPARAR